MSKIYSRRRIKIPEKFLNNVEKRKILIKISITIIISFFIIKVSLNGILPIFDTLCEDKAKSIATIISNEQATNVMKEHSYDEIFSNIRNYTEEYDEIY